MTQQSFLCKLSLFLFGIMMSLNISALESITSLDYELKKSYSKEFPVTHNSTVELSNKYGKIDIKTWNKPSVKVDVMVIVKASDKGNAEDKMSEIAITINKVGENVVCVTDFNSSQKSWWNSLWDFGDNIKIEINYSVYMPADQRSIIENKYGNINLPDLKAKTSINLKYGNLQAQNIDGDLLMDLSYGKATITSIKNLSATMAYSDLRCTSGGNNAIITSKYSKIYIDQVKSLTTTSKYDDYNIGNANLFTMSGSYNDVKIGTLSVGTFSIKYTGLDINSVSSTLTADVSYGSLTVQNLKTSFKNMTINTSYAPIKVYGTVPCKVEVSGKYFDANLGSDFILQQKHIDNNSKTFKGYKGSDRTGASINVVSKYGDVVIK